MWVLQEHSIEICFRVSGTNVKLISSLSNMALQWAFGKLWISLYPTIILPSPVLRYDTSINYGRWHHTWNRNPNLTEDKWVPPPLPDFRHPPCPARASAAAHWLKITLFQCSWAHLYQLTDPLVQLGVCVKVYGFQGLELKEGGKLFPCLLLIIFTTKKCEWEEIWLIILGLLLKQVLGS